MRWYPRYKLSLRDLVETMAERGRSLAHIIIMRRVRHHTPEFETRWRRFARVAGPSWRGDEIYIKIYANCCQLCRAVDRASQTTHFQSSASRDVAAAKAFFHKAIKGRGGAPKTITLDGYAAFHRAVRDLKAEGSLPDDTKLLWSKYLNNLIEQEYRSVRQCTAVMLGFERFRSAATTIAGIDLMHRVRKHQFKPPRQGLQGDAAPTIWDAVLAI